MEQKRYEMQMRACDVRDRLADAMREKHSALLGGGQAQSQAAGTPVSSSAGPPTFDPNCAPVPVGSPARTVGGPSASFGHSAQQFTSLPPQQSETTPQYCSGGAGAYAGYAVPPTQYAPPPTAMGVV